MSEDASEKENEETRPAYLEPPWPYRIVVFDADFFGAAPVDTLGNGE